MSDTITGISVLQPIWVPGIYRLWFTAQKADGTKAQGNIYIKDVSSKGLIDKMPDHDEGSNSIWKFTRCGSVLLSCFPSVNWISWGFHNGHDWTTNFVEVKTAERPYSKECIGRDRNQRGSAIHYDLSLVDDKAKMINELREQGIIV